MPPDKERLVALIKQYPRVPDAELGAYMDQLEAETGNWEIGKYFGDIRYNDWTPEQIIEDALANPPQAIVLDDRSLQAPDGGPAPPIDDSPPPLNEAQKLNLLQSLEEIHRENVDNAEVAESKAEEDYVRAESEGRLYQLYRDIAVFDEYHLEAEDEMIARDIFWDGSEAIVIERPRLDRVFLLELKGHYIKNRRNGIVTRSA